MHSAEITATGRCPICDLGLVTLEILVLLCTRHHCMSTPQPPESQSVRRLRVGPLAWSRAGQGWAQETKPAVHMGQPQNQSTTASSDHLFWGAKEVVGRKLCMFPPIFSSTWMRI